MYRKLMIAIAALITAAAASAAIPAGYYSQLNGKTTADLKKAVRNVIYPHTEVSSYSDLPNYFRSTDVYPDEFGPGGQLRWWEMYSYEHLYTPAPPARWSFSGLHREHSFPKSWWGGSDSTPAYTDLNHLYPSEGDANMAKSNYPLGEVATTTFDNGCTKVGYPVYGQGGGASQVFEPADEYKGDFARAYFYVVTCYSNLTWNSKYMYMLLQNDYPTLNSWSVDLLLKWNREDPVSQKEIQRNEMVYAFQNNRNPFIDFPDLCEYIWGSKMGSPFNAADSGTTGEVNLITPTQGMALDFGEVAVGRSNTSKLYFNGENCVGTFEITITGADKSMFKADTRQIAASAVNSSAGFWLSVTYTPTAEGTHSAKLIVSEGGLVGSRGIELIGEALPVPTLSTPVALAATDVLPNEYTANWEPAPEGEIVDFYVVTRTIYSGGNAQIEKIEAEGTSLIIDGFENSDSESYSVQASRLGFLSDPSNVVFVDHAGIASVGADRPLAAMSYPGYIRFVCGERNTDARIYDMQGRLVRYLPVIDNETTVTLPVGVYLITTREHHTPVRVVAF